MPQQINLCTPILLAQKRYFSAQTMLQAVAVFVVLGGALCMYWVSSLNSASAGFKKTLDAQAPELASLQAAVAASKVSAGSGEAALEQELQAARTERTQRQAVLEELHRGIVKEGHGHAARLQLVASSIPAQVWVTDVRADESQLDVSGFTLEPAALNEWVAKMAGSPLLQGQHLAAVKVNQVKADPAASNSATQTGTANQVALTARRPLWSFSLVNAVATVPASASGSKP